METVIVLAAVLLIPALAAGLLAARTRWPRWAIALIAATPLPTVALVLLLIEYRRAAATPPGLCGFSCQLDQSLTSVMALAALGGMAIAVVAAFLTAMIVRRRR